MRGKAIDGQRAGNGTSVAARLAMHSRLDPVSGCIVWTGARHDAAGYARIGINGRQVYAHRAAWEAQHGLIPAGMVTNESTPNSSPGNNELSVS